MKRYLSIVSLRKDNGSLIRDKVISESTEDLADTEIEKFKSLTDDVEFTDESSFKEKLDTLKESYFPKTKPVETETVMMMRKLAMHRTLILPTQ